MYTVRLFLGCDLCTDEHDSQRPTGSNFLWLKRKAPFLLKLFNTLTVIFARSFRIEVGVTSRRCVSQRISRVGCGNRGPH